MKRPLLLLLFKVLVISLIYGEGSRETAPNASININGNITNDIAALHINADAYDNFAAWNSTDTNARLYVTILDPEQEKIYLGFSYAHNNGSPNFPQDFTFRILDPNGNVVFGPVTFEGNNVPIQSYEEAVTGPMQIYGPMGYNAIEVTSADLTSAGWTGRGNYYIEFMSPANDFLIDYWDITVSDQENNDRKGRVWSYNWSFFAINDFGFPNRPFNGAFYVCAPDPNNPELSFISRIDFNGSGFRPAAFNITFNSFGTMNTGNIIEDRKSVPQMNSTIPEYAIYLNDPVEICDEGIIGTIDLVSLDQCTGGDYCINLLGTRAGQINILLDLFGDDGLYTPNTEDVILAYDLTSDSSGFTTCIPWDGLNGLGEEAFPANPDELTIYATYSQGVFHFPIYDAELMTHGFILTAVRPIAPTPLLHYDDSEIPEPPGTGIPPVNLDGCIVPCHTWINYQGGIDVGFGNLNTINQWWFLNSQEVSETFTIYPPLDCEINGEDLICIPQGQYPEFSLTLNDSINIDELDIEWSGTGDYEQLDLLTLQALEAGTFTVQVSWSDNPDEDCFCTSDFTVTQDPECCELEIICSPITDTVACDEMGIPDPLDLFEFIGEPCGVVNVKLDQMNIEGTGCISDPSITTVTYTAWDDINMNGMVDPSEEPIQCSAEIYSVDTEAPDIELTNPVLAALNAGDTLYYECGGPGPGFGLSDAEAVDNCDPAPELSMVDFLVASPECNGTVALEIYRCIYYAVDNCGNTDSFDFYIQWQDTKDPLLQVEPNVVLDCSEGNMPQALALDQCSSASLTFKDQVMDSLCGGEMVIQRTWTALDLCENSATAVQMIFIEDDEAPIITETAFDEEINDGDTLIFTCTSAQDVEWYNARGPKDLSLSDNCSEFTVDYTDELHYFSNCINNAYKLNTLKWEISDECGNTDDFTLYIVWKDYSPPILVEEPEFDCSTGNISDPVVEDECQFFSEYDFHINESTGACPEVRIYDVTLTVEDDCGNSGSYNYSYEDLSQVDVSFNPLHPDLFNVQSGDTITRECSSGLEFERKDVEIEIECAGTGVVQFNRIPLQNQCGVYEKYVWTAVSSCGDLGSYEVYINITDTIPPVILSRYQSEVLGCEEIEKDLYAQDLCEIDSFEVEYNTIDSTCISVKTVERTATATDLCGNTTIYIDTVEQRPMPEEFHFTLCSDSFYLPQMTKICNTEIESIIETFREEGECGIEIVNSIITDECGTTGRAIVEWYDTSIPVVWNHVTGIIVDSDTTIVRSCDDPINMNVWRPEAGCHDDYDVEWVKTVDSTCKIIEYWQLVTKVGICDRTINLKIEYIDETAPVFTTSIADRIIHCPLNVTPVPEAEDNCTEAQVFSSVTVEEGISPVDSVVTVAWETTDECGNSRVKEQVLTYQPLTCEVEVISSQDFCTGQILLEAALEDLPVNNYNYEWIIDEEGTAGVVIDENRITIGELLKRRVLVRVLVTDEHGCATECELWLECKSKTSLDQLTMPSQIVHNQIDMYPLEGLSEKSPTYIQISTLEGDPLYSKKFKGEIPSRIDAVNNLRPGIYIMNIINGRNTETVKLIKF